MPSRINSALVTLVLLAFLSPQLQAGRDLLARVGEDKDRKGVCRKLVITPKRGGEVTIVDTPGGKVVEKAEPFSFYFLLKEDDKKTIGKGGHLRVGDGFGKPIGYVPKDAVTHWDTLFCIEPFIGAGDKVFRVNLPGGDVAEFVSSVAGENVRCFVLSADVKSKDIKDEDTPYDILLYSGAARTADASAEEQEADREYSIKDTPLEIVFVIDTTLSMAPLIEVAKSVARRASDLLSSGGEAQGANVSFGLIEYRDGQYDAFDARVVSKLSRDRSGFLAGLTGLEPDGGGDPPEAVAKALETALDAKQVGWSERGNRQIVLLGDAPNKDGYGPTLEALATLCKAPGKTDAATALQAVSIQAIVNGNDAKTLEEFEKIAESTNKGGFYFKNIKAGSASDPAVEAASRELAEFFKTAFISTVAIGTGDAKKVRELAERNPDNAIVQRNWAIVSKNGDPKDTPELFHKGNASIRAANGKLVGARKVLVLESTLRRLGPALESFVEDLAGQDVNDIKNPELILELLQSALMHPITGDVATIRGSALKDIISNDLPIQTPSLGKTAEDIARMTNADFEDWKSQVKEAATIANTLVKESTWLGAGESKYAFIELKELP